MDCLVARLLERLAVVEYMRTVLSALPATKELVTVPKLTLKMEERAPERLPIS
jgi:hypothetical protein